MIQLETTPFSISFKQDNLLMMTLRIASAPPFTLHAKAVLLSLLLLNRGIFNYSVCPPRYWKSPGKRYHNNSQFGFLVLAIQASKAKQRLAQWEVDR